ncbi:MAG: hypothetical protein GF355_05775 [Candidatus Eisenbacteria bacterium]|nr:hypothetical protein [Candidatus Eisenbacteria bacterium]
MDLSLLQDIRFYDHLLRIDQDLFDRARKAGCLRCQGRLHSGRYPRKPRGAPEALGDEHRSRLSLCCAACRKRQTPPSVRFHGRRVYWGAAFVLACARKLTPGWIARLTEELGVDRRTLRRWRRWWQESFARSPWWRAARGRLMPPVDDGRLPASLLERFAGDQQAQLTALLQWLAPLGGSPI